MGNTVPKRTRREAGTDGKRSNSAVEVEARSAAPRRVVVAQREQRHKHNGEDVMLTTRVGRLRDAVSPGGGGGGDGATAVTVKILMRRKDADALVARLNAQNARERKARMAELKRQLGAGDDDGGGGASPAPSTCRDQWRPRLAPVQENQC